LVFGVLPRTDQLHLVVARLQAAHQAADGHRHAVDFGRIGFRDHRDAQLRPPRRQVLAGEFSCIHGRENAPGVRQPD
jgi:hypothetical protein